MRHGHVSYPYMYLNPHCTLKKGNRNPSDVAFTALQDELRQMKQTIKDQEATQQRQMEALLRASTTINQETI